MTKPTFLDLPTEIIRKYIFIYLADIDVYNLRNTGSIRLRELSEEYDHVKTKPNIDPFQLNNKPFTRDSET